MTESLVRWLGSLSAIERRAFLQLAGDDGGPVWLRGLATAIAAEITVDLVAEDMMVHRLEVERLAEIDAVAAGIDWPAPAGEPRTKTMFFDPATGETRVED